MSAPAIDVRGIAGHIGAEITGVWVGPDLDPGIVKLITSALHEHKVVFFRGQHHLDDAYESLSPALRSLAEGLWALHSNDYDYATVPA
jgi:alpha-ketoglutarate-dependent taurine dioxygenase